MQLSIPKDVEASILSQATAAGFLTAEEYILDLLSIDEPTVSDEPREQWLQKFDALVAKQKSHHPQIDDRRETIYPVR